MSYGDCWDEPATCAKCGQDRSTHDDGYCDMVVKVFSLPARAIKRETSLEAFRREGEPNGGSNAKAE